MRKHFILYGSVQGVGLRYRAYHAANRFGVTGYVRNNSDYSVEMELEGTEDAIDQVFMAIERGTFIHIENMDVRTIPEEGSYSFDIRD